MAQYVPRVGSLVSTPFRKLMWNLAGFRRYGLFYEDLYDNTPDVDEAIRRLPADVFDARNKRITLAVYASLNKTYLPESQWTKFEEDVKYLEPYLNEVRREFAEREAYELNNFETK